MLDSARLHDPTGWVRTLAYRERADLPFDAATLPRTAPLIFDTTVYIDAAEPGRLPPAVRELIAKRHALHAATACAEIAIGIGHLDPRHPHTPRHRAALESILALIEPLATRAPSPAAWTEAAVIAGILARIQGYQKDARRDLLLDALIFLTAREAGAVLLSRNVRHMDLLLRFRPDTQVLLYERA